MSVMTAVTSAGESATRQRYQAALDSLVEKLKRDPYILAAILCGSLSYDTVWAKSDIDLLIIVQEGRDAVKDFCLVEDGVNIHALVYTRSKFKQQLEGGLRGSFFQSYFSRSTLLFTNDESLQEYYENVRHIGARDRELQLLRDSLWVLATLAKAEKWLTIKNDPIYSSVWLLSVVNALASIEVVLNGEVPGREVVQEAMKYNPQLFQEIYLDLIEQPKTRQNVTRVIGRINDLLDSRLDLLFHPILEFLQEAGSVRSTSEIDIYFKKQVQVGSLAIAYEWLADKGVIRKVSSPVRLTEKGRTYVDEAAYYYDGPEGDSSEL